MRKSLFLTLLIAISSLHCVQGQSSLRPRGDVNCDWEVNVADINVLVDSILSGVQYHSLYTYAHDINGDKEINIADINMVISAICGQELPPMPTYSGTLPVLFINTEEHRDIVSRENEDYLHANWWLDNMGIEGIEPIGSPDAPLGMLIKGRGNYSWTNYSKKPFRLKLDEKQELLGLTSSRHWVLLANASSKFGQIENTLPYEIGRRMGMSWNPHLEPVEVVLNGQYIGMYFLAEKIRVAKDRVNIEEQADEETRPEYITGGWLLEIDNYREPDNISFIEGNGKSFWVTPHSPEHLSPEQRVYITDFLKNADTAIYCSDKSSTLWEQYIDIDSLAIYYVVQEIAHNMEAFNGSCYMHKSRGDSTRLVFGPIWDCDHSYFDTKGKARFDYFIYQLVPSNWYSRWIGEIAKFPRFQSRVHYYWKHFYDDVYPTIDGYLDVFASKIEQAGYHDAVRWPQYVGNYNIPGRLNTYGRPYFHWKVAWLQSQWGNDQE